MGERRTAREAVMSQTCHGGGNIYGRERSTVSETFPLQFFYGGGNVYRSERRTVSVFVCYFISMIYTLNGRKVKMWIL